MVLQRLLNARKDEAMKKTLMVFGVLLAVGGAWLGLKLYAPASLEQSTVADRAGSASTFPMPRTEGATFPTPSSSGPQGRLGVAGAQDLSVLIAQARSNPQGGSYTLALNAIDTCQTVNAMVAVYGKEDRTADDPRIKAARQALLKRCANVKGSNLGGTYQALFSEAVTQGDALVRVTGGPQPISSQKIERKEEFVRLLRNADNPELVRQALAFIPVVTELKNSLEINGRTFSSLSPSEQLNLSVALKLVPCDLGQVCGPENIEVLGVCASGTCSYGSYEELIRAQYGSMGGRGFDWAQVERFRAQLATGIKTSDPKVFSWRS